MTSLFTENMTLLITDYIAASEQLFPIISRPFLTIIFITQVTPIVAFIPLIAFYLGRGSVSIETIVILSTIYPAYIVFKKSFEDVSQNAIDTARSFGANKLLVFSKIQFPYSAWMLVVAFRLAIGRALLGAITAEYLLTGSGLGGLLGQSRAQLDFTFVWLICVLVGIVTVVTDLLAISFINLLKRLSKGNNNTYSLTYLS